MNHDEALDKIINYFLSRSLSEKELHGAKLHIAGCHECVDQLNDIMSILLGKPAKLREEVNALIECHKTTTLLPDFVTGIMDPASAEYQRIERHLETCNRCQAEKEILIHLVEEAQKELESETPGKPFGIELHPNITQPSLWNKIGKGFKRLASEVKISIEGNIAAFSPDLELVGLKLAEAPAISGAKRSLRGASKPGDRVESIPKTQSEKAAKPVFQFLEIPDEAMNLTMQLKILDTESIEIKLQRLDHSQGIENATVSIVDRASGEVLDSQDTDREGVALCGGIPFISGNEYVLRILQDGLRWEIYLS